jgi:xylono-1,5-lactonase
MSRGPEPQCVWPVAATLGEGPVWAAAEQALWFVDIKSARVHRFDSAGGDHRSYEVGEAPSFLLPCRSGGFLLGLKSGLHRLDPESGEVTPLQDVEADKPGNRLNDGAVDGVGRVWFGSMDDAEREPSGSLYRFDKRGLALVETGYVITNGPAFCPQNRTLYHTDTLGRVIHAFDLSSTGGVSNKRVFVTIEGSAGFPDGSTVDSEGCVWTALFGGWGVRRYSSDGELLQEIRFPCSNVTKIAFGGTDLRTVYATTARKGLSAEDLASQPLAGGLFSFRTDIPGLPQRAVAFI